jgi:hypothetical protein
MEEARRSGYPRHGEVEIVAHIFAESEDQGR